MACIIFCICCRWAASQYFMSCTAFAICVTYGSCTAMGVSIGAGSCCKTSWSPATTPCTIFPWCMPTSWIVRLVVYCSSRCAFLENCLNPDHVFCTVSMRFYSRIDDSNLPVMWMITYTMLSAWCYGWDLPVLRYHGIMAIYPYPFLVVITQLFSYIIFINDCICILTGLPG